MTIKNKIIKLTEEDNHTNEIIIAILHTNNYSNEEIFEELRDNYEELSSYGMVFCSDDITSFNSWLNQTINSLREKIESNNEIFKNVSKHDIISSREHTMQQNVNLSNELYHIKNYVKQLENDKIDLQIKLERARNCDMRKNVYCYECEDNSCINNIYYSLRKEK